MSYVPYVVVNDAIYPLPVYWAIIDVRWKKSLVIKKWGNNYTRILPERFGRHTP